jgi:hypothetical protein
MAETLISPGVLARENDQSFIQGQPIEAGAAIVGPAVKGPVGIPTLVTSFSEYLSTFGGAVTSGSSEYTYLTSISANNYFSQGGKSLLVTRVVSGSFSDADTSNQIQCLEHESGVLALQAISLTGGTDGIPNTYTTVSPTSTSGSGAEFTIITGITSGKLTPSTSGLTSAVSSSYDDSGNNTTYSDVAVTTDGSGEGALLYISIDTDGSILQATATTQGSGYAVGDKITVSAGMIGSGVDLEFTLTSDQFQAEIESATVTNGGSGYILGEVLTINGDDLGSAENATITLGASNIVNATSFALGTISEGVIMNSAGSEVGNGALANGSSDNIRYEIVSSNANTGTFSLLVRRGNDTHKNKSILETWGNLSLDPKAPNYIEKVIGNTTYDVEVDGVDSYVKSSGEYTNKSKYIIVKSVSKKTPDYFDNNGTPKSIFTGSLPQVGSGSFSGATGDLFGADAKFYDEITNTNIQGLAPHEYTSSIALLNNKDDYKFNLLTAPGLNNSDHSDATSQLVTVAETRQDCIAVVDLDGYGTKISTMITNAAAFDSSYGATYWPWLQTIDPNTGQVVWVPASTMIPGVYAFTDASSDAWFAPAGLTRGALGNVTKAERKLTTSNRDSLYEVNINPIATFPGSGVVVFGQKTLQKRASALDRVNVRRLLIALKSFISQISDNLVFEQNTIATRNSFLADVNPYLESVQQRQGLYAFKVVMDDTNNTPDVIDRNQLVGQIYIQPTRTAEFIMLDFNVLPTGAVFPE